MLKFKNSTANGQEMYITGDIIDDADGETLAFWLGDEGKDYISTKYNWPADIKAQLDAMDRNKPLTVYINSDGGSVPAGIAISNMLKRWGAPVTTVVDGWACSIATQIFFSGTVRRMPTNAYLMIHKPTVTCSGNADDMRKAADILDTLQDGLESTYRAAAKSVTSEEIHKMVDTETWLTGDEACDIFNIEPLAPVNAVAKFNRAADRFRNIPADIKREKFTAQPVTPPPAKESEKVSDKAEKARDYVAATLLNANKAIVKAAFMAAER